MNCYKDEFVELHHGDCLDVMRTLPDNSVDSIVTDPPYGLGFMGKAWDDLPPGLPWAQECLRVLKPGGHLLAFGGTRTWHRLACAVEDAGFEMRDSIAWIHAQGFPKSLDVSKAIDKAAGAQREILRECTYALTDGGGYSGNLNTSKPRSESAEISAPATPDAARWQGWGTSLKPAFEPVVVGRKPLVGTVAANVLAYSTGALNIDGCRVDVGEGDALRTATYVGSNPGSAGHTMGDGWAGQGTNVPMWSGKGRWPANVVLDGSQADALDAQSGGDPSRFFPTFHYQAKAPTSERPKVDGVAHPTVKPLSFMRWLVRLVTPPGGTVLEPFAGSGTTVEACVLEGFKCIAIEREATYLPLIAARLSRSVATLHDIPEEVVGWAYTEWCKLEQEAA